MDVDRVDPEGNRQYFSGGPAVSCGQNLAQPCPFSPPCGDHLDWIEFQRSCVPHIRAQYRREQAAMEASEGSRCSYCGECLVQWNNSFEEWLSECEAFRRETGVAPWWVARDAEDDPMENDDDRDEDGHLAPPSTDPVEDFEDDAMDEDEGQDGGSLMQVLFKLNVAGVVQFKQVEEMTSDDRDDGWQDTGGSSLAEPEQQPASTDWPTVCKVLDERAKEDAGANTFGQDSSTQPAAGLIGYRLRRRPLCF